MFFQMLRATIALAVLVLIGLVFSPSLLVVALVVLLAALSELRPSWVQSVVSGGHGRVSSMVYSTGSGGHFGLSRFTFFSPVLMVWATICRLLSLASHAVWLYLVPLLSVRFRPAPAMVST